MHRANGEIAAADPPHATRRSHEYLENIVLLPAVAQQADKAGGRRGIHAEGGREGLNDAWARGGGREQTIARRLSSKVNNERRSQRDSVPQASDNGGNSLSGRLPNII